MKKLLMGLMVLLVLTLVACKNDEKKTIEEWALHYVLEDVEVRYEGTVIIGYTIEKYVILDGTDDDYPHDYNMYKITILSNSGGNVIYNILVGYEINQFRKTANAIYNNKTPNPKIFESAILDVDYEVIEYE